MGGSTAPSSQKALTYILRLSSEDTSLEALMGAEIGLGMVVGLS